MIVRERMNEISRTRLNTPSMIGVGAAHKVVELLAFLKDNTNTVVQWMDGMQYYDRISLLAFRAASDYLKIPMSSIYSFEIFYYLFNTKTLRGIFGEPKLKFIMDDEAYGDDKLGHIIEASMWENPTFVYFVDHTDKKSMLLMDMHFAKKIFNIK